MTNSRTEVSSVNELANRFDHPKVGKRETSAVGLPGALIGMSYGLQEHGLASLWKMNRHGGVDCPGCAWPDPAQQDQGVVEFCENGAKAIAEETTGRRVGPEFFAEHSISELRNKTDYWLGRQGRLTTPMYCEQGDDHYRPISWDEAIDVIVDELKTLDNPNDAIFYTSGRTSNESAYVYQLLARRLGTNNLPDCANMCHDSTGKALGSTVGLGKGSVVIEDFYNTDLVISMGSNPGTNHPRMLKALENCKKNGGKIIAVNPLPEAGLFGFKDPQTPGGLLGKASKLADVYLQIRLNGDMAFMQLLNRELIRRDAIDHVFLDKFCSNVEETIEHLKNVDEEAALMSCGLTMAEIMKVADMVEESATAIVSWTLGVTQHKNAVATIREMTNFLLLTGNIGKPGAGTAPLRGHSNVQGDRTMGISEAPAEKFSDALQNHFGFETPREHGYSTVDATLAMWEGRSKVFMSMGGNYVRVVSDTTRAEVGMEKQNLTVHLNTKLNGTHLWPGKKSLILPVLARTDLDMQASGPQSVTVEDSASAVHASTGDRKANLDLDLKSEIWITCEIGKRLFGDDFWQPMVDNYDVIRDHIEATIPGFDDFNRRIKDPGGFMLPNGPRERVFNTPDGKAHLSVNKLEPLVLEEGYLLLNTVRSHDQYNSTIYGLNDRYRGIKGGRRVVFVNPEDCRERGLKDGDLVDIVSVWKDEERRAPNFRVVEYSTAKDCVAAYFPEANVLVPVDSFADESRTPVSKSVVVRLEPLGKRAEDVEKVNVNV
ncbi:FdhF/YdeP family oxidoreductase [Corynebacterium sp. H130]|uniref:FdhF/YdeP family oxidoreductase n=1 Tax=Corynebacterium sp. H130 TaxID=3133444 RepID=UPI0030AC2B6E